jgi:hypothetical protein
MLTIEQGTPRLKEFTNALKEVRAGSLAPFE